MDETLKYFDGTLNLLKGLIMKIFKSMLIVLLVCIAMVSGCVSQDGGMKVEGPKIDKNGVSLFSLETNGSQVAMGDPNSRDAANMRFNGTLAKKEKSNLLKDSMRLGVSSTSKDLQDVAVAANSIF